MNVNVWNIKDMFSIPPGTGANKSSGRTSTPSDYSSLTDSQFVFGSQFCPDNSQPGSLEVPSHSKQQKNSQHNSQDSEPSVYVKYQMKPQLFSDFKDRGSFLPLAAGKSKGVFEQFEENKKKAKEKYDNEQLFNFISNFQETMQGLKMIFCQFDENTNTKCKSILDSVETVFKALQDSAASYHGSIIKALSAKDNMEQALLDIETKMHTRDSDITALGSNMQLILSCMDALKTQQSEQHLQLSEKLTCLSDYIKSSENKILHKLQKMSLAHQRAASLKDNSTQTCPTLVQEISTKHNIKSQFNTMKTCSYVSPASQTNGHRITNGANNIVFSSFSEDLTANKAVVAVQKPLGYIQTPIIDFSSVDQNQRKSKSTIVNNRTGGKRQALRYRTLHQNDNCKSQNQNSFLEDSSVEKENVLLRQKSAKNVKRKRASKRKVTKRKKNALSSKKNNPGLVSKAIIKNSQDTFEEGSVTWAWKNPSPKDSVILQSDRGEPSLSVIHAPVRKAQQRNRENFSALCSKKTIAYFSSTEDKTSAGEKLEVSKAEQKLTHWNLSSQDSHHLHYSIKSTGMNWLSPSSSVTSNSNNASVSKPEHKSFMSLFFDSSEDSD